MSGRETDLGPVDLQSSHSILPSLRHLWCHKNKEGVASISLEFMRKPIEMALHQSRHSCERSTLYGKLKREGFEARKRGNLSGSSKGKALHTSAKDFDVTQDDWEMGGMVWFNLPENCWKWVSGEGRRQFYKKVSSHRMTKRAHFNECINLPVRSPRKRECRGLNDVRVWGRESRLWENAPVGSSKEKAFSLLLGPARLLSPVTMRGLPRPPAPWLPLLH